MNRAQRREFTKRARAKGIPDDYIGSYINMLSTREFTTPMIKDGDTVQIDVDRIKSGKDYERMNEEYKAFVESSVGISYTAHIEEEGCLASLDENPKWLFWIGNLIRVPESGS